MLLENLIQLLALYFVYPEQKDQSEIETKPEGIKKFSTSFFFA
ncbi:hypothetical protein FM120_36755 [Sphingobacterium faecium PCAi_F2.5]|nr:hypothetical protein FM120_36755 [Sphingobacterium faecium PCAi_F2.5]